jgi:hypothetical protein
MATQRGRPAAIGGRGGNFLRRRPTTDSDECVRHPEFGASDEQYWHPVAFAALILVIWIALGIVVIGLLNLAKWTIRHSHQPERATTTTAGARPWPAPQPVAQRGLAAPTAMRPGPSGIRSVGFESFTPR